MALPSKSIGTAILRVLALLWLLGWPSSASPAGTWSVIPFPGKPGEVSSPAAAAVDAAGNLYVVDQGVGIQRRDGQGHWSVLATCGPGPGLVIDPTALAVDATGNLYVAQRGGIGPIQQRDAQGHWSVIARGGTGGGLGQVYFPTALAVDTASNLYVAERGYTDSRGQPVGATRIQQRDAQGHWSLIATGGSGLGQVISPSALAVDPAGDLYVADVRDLNTGNSRIQKRDVQGNCYENRIPGPVQARGTPTAPRLAAATGR